MAGQFKILAWNVDGLSLKLNEVALALNTHNVYICLLSETHDNEQTKINVHGYAYYYSRFPQNVSRGGVGILIKQTIKHAEYYKLSLECTQVVAISIKTNSGDQVIASMYNPPKFSPKLIPFDEIFEELNSS